MKSKLLQYGVASLLGIATVITLIPSVQAYPGQFQRNHPRRAEVLHRDSRLNHELNWDKGHLSGHYKQLKREDSAIHAQEQADARYNGGGISRGEQRQLNHEENHLHHQIRRDSRY